MSVKKIYVSEKDYIWNPSKCICENGKYLASTMDDSTIMWWSYRILRRRNKNHSNKF